MTFSKAPPDARRPKAPPMPDGSGNMNPADIDFWALVAEDLRTNDGDILSQGFWILFWQRFGNWRMSVHLKLLRAPLTVIYCTMYRLGQWMGGMQLPYTVQVGRRVRLDHFGGMILVARRIGNDVTLRQNTTLGIASKSDLNAKPVLEDHVDVGAGAALLGDIVIGRGAIIGANAVVTRSVPPYAVMGGVPARLIRMRDPVEIGDPPQSAPECPTAQT